MGPKGRADTQTNWSTACRPQEELQLQIQVFKDLCGGRLEYLHRSPCES
jgi:hypothetical protein